MEGLVKIISKVAIGFAAVGLAGYLAVGAHAFYHGGVTYTWQSKTIGWKGDVPERPSWETEYWVITLSKGPGRDNVDRDLQYIVDHDVSLTAVCTSCGAHQDQIVTKKNQ